MEQTSQKLHPLLIVAASAVTIASLAAIASFSGLLPTKSGPETALTATPAVTAPAPASETAPPPAPVAKPPKPQAVAPRPAPRPASERPLADERPPLYGGTAGIPLPTRSTLPPAPPPCRDCGTVEAVREINTPTGEASGLGAVAGGVVGGLLGNQVGRGKGNQAATVIGALGGAYAGHQVEKKVRTDKQLQVTVRFDDGSVRSYTQEAGGSWQNGDRVRVHEGKLAPL